jgi:hypothetical protein
MKKKIQILVVTLLGATALISCKEAPRIDGSSKEKFTESYRKVKDSLSEDEKDRFDKATMVIGLMGPVPVDLNSDGDPIRTRMRENLDGMSADDVFEASKKIRIKN